MLSRKVRIQVALFVVLGMLGVTYVGARYVGLDAMFGASGYVVRVHLADSGGIFTNAEVTYRGVAIGRVGELRLVDNGVEVDLEIRSSEQKVPTAVDAVVTTRSAVGEHYVDLRPKTDQGPFLADGAVIPQQSTTLPLPVETVLLNVDKLVASVPHDALRIVVDEMYQATRDAGPDLQLLLDSSRRFVATATEHLPQTKQLITNADRVLATQREHSAAITSFAANAKLISEQLRRSDGDLRNVLSTAPQVSEQVSAVLKESGPNFGVVLANLLTTSQVMATRQAGMEQVLVLAPTVVAAGADAVRGGVVHAGLTTTFFSPPPCTAGYEGTAYRNGLDLSTAPFNAGARCALPHGNETGVRGSQNAPKGGPR